MALKPSINTPYAQQNRELYGIDGLLRLVQLHMGLYVLLLGFRVFTDIQAIASGYDYLYLIIDLGLAAFQISLLIVSFILMVNKLMLFRVFYTVLLATFIINAVFWMFSGEIGGGIYDVIVCTIWIVYLYRSERVKNTFRKLGQAKTDYEIKKEEKKQKSQEIMQQA